MYFSNDELKPAIIKIVITLLTTLFCVTPVFANNHNAKQNSILESIIVYNNTQDSYYKIFLQVEGEDIPERTIGIPMWLAYFDWTKAEAGALIAAIGAYVTPDIRFKPRERLDREARFERLMAALESCPAALSAVILALDAHEKGNGLAATLREIRTKRVDYVVPPRRIC